MNNELTVIGLTLTGNIIVAYLPALLSVMAIACMQKKAALLLAGGAVLLAYSDGIITPAALLGLGALFGFSYGFACTARLSLKVPLGLALFVLVSSMLIHLWPGFNNPLVTDAVSISDNAVTYSKHLNFDKLMVAIALMCFVLPERKTLTIKDWQSIGLVSLVTILVGFSIGHASGLVAFEPKWSPYFIGWAVTNLFITCFAEEALFRGFIQTQLTRISAHFGDEKVAILFSGLLFGLAHLPAGLTYSAIATLLGLACAYGYHKTYNLLVPIGIHFVFNLIHFCFFSYPYIA